MLRELLSSSDERVRLSAAQTLARLPSTAPPGSGDPDDDLSTEFA